MRIHASSHPNLNFLEKEPTSIFVVSFQAPKGSSVSDPKSGLGSEFNWIGGSGSRQGKNSTKRKK
jgi:hypothetical protein